jgi:sugar O-acyltransferase (sialic acid O-acetyltransferase NeuD family)
MKRAIIGYGGFAQEVCNSIKKTDNVEINVFFIDDEYYIGQEKTIPISKFNPKEYEVIIAIGDPKIRFNMVSKLPKETKYFTHIHKSVIILGDDVEIGHGSIICAGSILTSNIKIGSHCQLNLQTTIGHDTSLGNFFTSAPGVKISGNCEIGDKVYFGTNSCTKQKIKITNNVTIGLNSGVVKDINESGVYIGTPSKKINS